MYVWTTKRLLKFNKEKCKIVHLSKKNKKNMTILLVPPGEDRIKLEKSDLQKDLGVYIDPDLKFKNHIKIL